MSSDRWSNIPCTRWRTLGSLSSAKYTSTGPWASTAKRSKRGRLGFLVANAEAPDCACRRALRCQCRVGRRRPTPPRSGPGRTAAGPRRCCRRDCRSPRLPQPRERRRRRARCHERTGGRHITRNAVRRVVVEKTARFQHCPANAGLRALALSRSRSVERSTVAGEAPAEAGNQFEAGLGDRYCLRLPPACTGAPVRFTLADRGAAWT